jgi:hypothetical protein
MLKLRWLDFEAIWIKAWSVVAKLGTTHALVLSGADAWMGFMSNGPWRSARRLAFG